MISVLVANPKGGCGKTTIATNPAFANAGFKTALADGDRQRSSGCARSGIVSSLQWPK